MDIDDGEPASDSVDDNSANHLLGKCNKIRQISDYQMAHGWKAHIGGTSDMDSQIFRDIALLKPERTDLQEGNTRPDLDSVNPPVPTSREIRLPKHVQSLKERLRDRLPLLRMRKATVGLKETVLPTMPESRKPVNPQDIMAPPKAEIFEGSLHPSSFE